MRRPHSGEPSSLQTMHSNVHPPLEHMSLFFFNSNSPGHLKYPLVSLWPFSNAPARDASSALYATVTTTDTVSPFTKSVASSNDFTTGERNKTLVCHLSFPKVSTNDASH